MDHVVELPDCEVTVTDIKKFGAWGQEREK